ncbi:CDGSH iron-sulfur domain-containing protein [Acidihalobacter prosperus]|uniref:Glutamate synthetase n=1 Tax=Acidihalobacter prosperus TaxID=160660 RepID=A0A1A6C3Y9_9GAMM|nr:CDGSH iron-sulfur domain-containing protein [Acidihalobacter prosperus]OBS09260.1 putative glutamate synthetase [Acidihalobacter prosperus]
MNAQPKIARKGPYAVTVEANKSYFWCACGFSRRQPFCDGAHTRNGFTPVQFTAERTETVYLCGCKRTGNPPFCDGTHETL